MNPSVTFRFAGIVCITWFVFATTYGQKLLIEPGYPSGYAREKENARRRVQDAGPDTALIPAGMTPLTGLTPIDFNTVFMVGDATPNGWNIENATELIKNQSDPWEFNYTGILKVGDVKFPVNRNKFWGQDFFLKSSDHLMFLGKTPDSKWSITEETVYQLKMNIKTLAISITKVDVAITGMVAAGQANCYNATQTITVAGGGTAFMVENGGNAILIAGQNIIFMPGTHVFQNGYLQGYISDTYCGQISAPVTSLDTLEDTPPEISTACAFKIYPNPSYGCFNLELSPEPNNQPIKIACYNHLGYLVIEKEIHAGMKHEISLKDQPSGMYLLRVNQNGNIGVRKILKH